MTRILFFDGYCTLCNGLVDWVIRRDRKRRIRFASLQGETAAARLLGRAAEDADPDTVLYLRGEEVLERSSAILSLVVDLGGVWRLASIGFLVPRMIRDFVYRRVAANRYRLFGRRDTCRLPTPEEKDLLLP